LPDHEDVLAGDLRCIPQARRSAGGHVTQIRDDHPPQR
jgi:hypothetical protein